MGSRPYIRRDYYYRLAKKKNFRSRAAFKLLQIDRKFRIFRKGDVVVDLGAAPGGWTEVARKLSGDEGFILAVDIKPVTVFPYKNIKFLLTDINNPNAVEKIQLALPQKADVVLSDLAPNVSGHWELDHLKQILLAKRALNISRKVLKRNGKFVVKVFQGSSSESFFKEVKNYFKQVKRFKPKASRARSAEIYFIAKYLKEEVLSGC